MDRINKLHTAKEKINELKDGLEESSYNKIRREKNMENIEGIEDMVRKLNVFIWSHRRRGERRSKNLKR